MVIYNKANLGMTLKFKKEDAIMENLNFEALWAEILKFFDTLAAYLKDMIEANI